MGAIGDSITTGYGAGGAPTDSSRFSYATGANVLSHLRRLNAMNEAIAGYNFAATGTKIAALVEKATAPDGVTPIPNQIDRLPRDVEYVTVTVGSADLCQGANPTGVGRFQTKSGELMEQLQDRLGGAESGANVVVVLPIPDWVGIWRDLHTDPAMQDRWMRSGACARVFGEDATPTSRDEMDTLVRTYNELLASACGAANTVRFKCSFASRVLTIDWTANDLSSYDGFHPSRAGQAKLSKAAWWNSPYRLAKWGLRFNNEPAFNRRKKILRLNFNTAPNAHATIKVKDRRGRLLGLARFNASDTGAVIQTMRVPGWKRNVNKLKLKLKITLSDEAMRRGRTLRV